MDWTTAWFVVGAVLNIFNACWGYCSQDDLLFVVGLVGSVVCPVAAVMRWLGN